jgi:hypothetical protein
MALRPHRRQRLNYFEREMSLSKFDQSTNHQDFGSHFTQVARALSFLHQSKVLSITILLCFQCTIVIHVACGRCPNQTCGQVCQKIDGTINVCESQEIFQYTEDAIAFYNCPTVVLGASVRMEYDAGLVDNLCRKCKWRESRQLHQ